MHRTKTVAKNKNIKLKRENFSNKKKGIEKLVSTDHNNRFSGFVQKLLPTFYFTVKTLLFNAIQCHCT